MKSRLIKGAVSLVALVMLAGCATQIHPPAQPSGPLSTPLSSFGKISLEPVTISPAYAGSGANQKALRKIQENLEKEYRAAFPGIEVLGKGETASGAGVVIRPNVREIKFIGGAARFWVGAMAGSSAVLMDVDHVDLSTGESIGVGTVYAKASAFGDGFGIADNMMLVKIAEYAAYYSAANR